MHECDLADGAAEAEEADFQPDGEGLAEGWGWWGIGHSLDCAQRFKYSTVMGRKLAAVLNCGPEGTRVERR